MVNFVLGLFFCNKKKLSKIQVIEGWIEGNWCKLYEYTIIHIDTIGIATIWKHHCEEHMQRSQ